VQVLRGILLFLYQDCHNLLKALPGAEYLTAAFTVHRFRFGYLDRSEEFIFKYSFAFVSECVFRTGFDAALADYAEAAVPAEAERIRIGRQRLYLAAVETRQALGAALVVAGDGANESDFVFFKRQIGFRQAGKVGEDRTQLLTSVDEIEVAIQSRWWFDWFLLS
jgi:hypothetical protein